MTGTPRHTERGFSLIELVIVLIIAAILGAIIMLSTRGTDATVKQQAMQSVAGQVFSAANAFNADFPKVTGADPLTDFTARSAIRRQLNESGGALPTAESNEADLGFFTKTGRPYFTKRLESPYGGDLTILRGSCPSPGAIGTVYVCRPASSTTGVRVTAWARSRSGTAILVFDKVA